jgi:hypothetical protein
MSYNPRYFERLQIPDQESLKRVLLHYGHNSTKWKLTPEYLFNQIDQGCYSLCLNSITLKLFREINVNVLSLTSPDNTLQLVELLSDEGLPRQLQNKPLIIRLSNNRRIPSNELRDVLLDLGIDKTGPIFSNCDIEISNDRSREGKFGDLRSKLTWHKHSSRVFDSSFVKEGYNYFKPDGTLCKFEWRPRYFLSERDLWIKLVLQDINARYSIVKIPGYYAITISDENVIINGSGDDLAIIDFRGQEVKEYKIDDYNSILRSPPKLKCKK